MDIEKMKEPRKKKFKVDPHVKIGELENKLNILGVQYDQVVKQNRTLQRQLLNGNEKLETLFSKDSILSQLGNCAAISESISLPLMDVEDFAQEDFEKIHEVWAYLSEISDALGYDIPEYTGM